MKISNWLWIGISIIIFILFIGFLSEQKKLRSLYSKESFRFQIAVETCQEKIERSCKGLYPEHLTSMKEEEIKQHPDFRLYLECLETARKEQC